MNEVRRAWMRTMLGRDNRITDAFLIGHTVHSATFFASIAMVALAALLGMLGALDRSMAALDALAFTAKTSRMLAEAKLLRQGRQQSPVRHLDRVARPPGVR